MPQSMRSIQSVAIARPSVNLAWLYRTAACTPPTSALMQELKLDPVEKYSVGDPCKESALLD